jgi:hypothetical protein
MPARRQGLPQALHRRPIPELAPLQLDLARDRHDADKLLKDNRDAAPRRFCLEPLPRQSAERVESSQHVLRAVRYPVLYRSTLLGIFESAK